MSNKELKISYLGVKGAYSYQACEAYFPNQFYRGFQTFHDAADALLNGEVDYAVIPVENSIAGRVMEVYNLLPSLPVHIVGEHLLPISHCLLLPFGAFRGRPPYEMSTDEVIKWKLTPINENEISEALAQVKEVHSHPHALAQCRDFIRKKLPRALARETWDTASSARDIASEKSCDRASIASAMAAENYNMVIVARDIQDVKNNTTRFLVLATKPLPPSEIKGTALTTLIFETDHKAGALVRALQCFENNNISLTKLETYMAGAEKPHPKFYVDVAANLDDKSMQQALKDLKNNTLSIRILGCYAASERRKDNSAFLLA